LGGPSEVDTEALKRENEELKARVEELQTKLDQLINGTTGESTNPAETTA
jgi:cell division septum initiation protein DivIVA